MSGIGHNSVQGKELSSFIERWEALEEEIKERRLDQKQIMAEAKAKDFDVKTLRTVIKIRAMDPIKREAADQLLETYLNALGMLRDTPLGDAAVTRDFKRVPRKGKSKTEEISHQQEATQSQQQLATDPDGFPLNSESAPLYGETLNGQDSSSEAA